MKTPHHRPPLRTPYRVLQAIKALERREGKPPTIRELQAHLNKDRGKPPVRSTKTVLRYLQKLEKAGEIKRWDGARGIRVLEEGGG
jgi:hypothetical protein